MTALTPELASARLPKANLDKLFRPASVAVVGASATVGKLGNSMLNAVASGAPVAYGINPKLNSGRFHPTLSAATDANGGAIDLAVLCVPADITPRALLEAADQGVGSALICSGGFAEAGPAGVRLQDQIAEICAGTGIRVLGPNTSGFFRPGRTVASFVPTVSDIAAGPVAVVAASGGMNHALSFLLSERGVGVALGVGLGNSVDVTSVDVLRYLAADSDVSAVALHVESVVDGPALLDAVREMSAHKPIVAIVVGRSDVSAFSESHTGALATSWRTTRALLAQAGAVIVESDHELVDALSVLSRTRLPAMLDPAIGVVTAQAGPGLMVLDDLQARGVRVPRLGSSTVDALAKLLPPLTYQSNPVDTGRPGASFADVLATTAADPCIDALAVYTLAEPDAIDIGAAVRQSQVSEQYPVVLGVGGPAHVVSATTGTADSLGVPVLPSPTSLAAGVAALVRDSRQQHLLSSAPTPIAEVPSLAALPASFDEAAAKDILDGLGIATPDRRVCVDRAAAHRALVALRPVAVKILDANVLHKTELGGVHLGITDSAELDAALDALDAIGARAYLIESMAESGVDLFLGARRDPVFGPIVVAGLGGTAAEAIGDVSIRSGGLTRNAAETMLDELQFVPLLDGWRGGPQVNRADFAAIAMSVLQFLCAHDELSEIEINPLRLAGTKLVALDAVVIPAGESPVDKGIPA